jgi:hypothetical protein
MRARVTIRSIVLTLAVVALGVAWIAVIDRPAAPRPMGPPTSRASAMPAARLAAPARAREVLARADVLALSAAQRARLGALADAWDVEARPLQRAEDVQSLSALVRERRGRHAAEALALLTPSQRERLPEVHPMTGGTR